MTQSDDAKPNTDGAAVLRSWQDNAVPWIDAIRQAKIRSRTLVTNRAIVAAIEARTPSRVLDMGCGEGWLSWHLAANGISVLGIDAIAALVDAAKNYPSAAVPPPKFLELDYENVPQALLGERFDLIVCNFSLLDRDGVATLLRVLATLLAPGGALLIQTLHPDHIGTPETRIDGWRSESWQGIGDEFRGQSPWYYRTLSSWRSLFTQSGLHLMTQLEPQHPDTGLPASIIFVLEARPCFDFER